MKKAIKKEFGMSNTPILWCIPIGIAFRGMGVVYFIYYMMKMAFTSIAITDNTIIGTKGFLGRQTMMTTLGRYVSVMVKQSIFGRIFNTGTIIISMPSGTYKYSLMHNPNHIRDEILRQQNKVMQKA